MKTIRRLCLEPALRPIFLLAFLAQTAVGAVCVPLPTGALGWWKGENAGQDMIGTNHGILMGNTAYSAARVGTGFVFDGTGDAVRVGNPTGFQVQDLTIEAWVKRNSTSAVTFGSWGNALLFSYGAGGYGLYLDATGRPSFSKIEYNEVKAGIVISDTNFHHVAVTKSGSTVMFYVDGVGYPAAAYDPGFTFETTAAIGGRDNLDNSFIGMVDEVTLYGRSLTASEIQAIYAAGSEGKCGVTPQDPCVSSLNIAAWWKGEGSAGDVLGSNNGLLEGGVSFGAGKVGQAFLLNGADGKVTVPSSEALNLASNQNFSIEGWINAEASTTSFDFMTIVDKKVTPNIGASKGYELGLTGGRLHARLSTSLSGNGIAWGPIGPDLRDGVFHHIAWVVDRDSTTGGSLYVDGGVVLTFDPTGQSGDLSTDAPLRIGHHSLATLSTFFKGAIDELTLYREALSAESVAAIFNAGKAGKCETKVAPLITSQPQSVEVAVGEDVSLSVSSTGTEPLHFQWFFQNGPLVGATSRTLSLDNVTTSNAGTYFVQVTNSVGIALSSNALVTVSNLSSGCVAAPAGLANWWQGEGNGLDSMGTNNGVLADLTFTNALVGQGFRFNGSSSRITVPNSPSFNFGTAQDFSIEVWIRPEANSTEFGWMTIVDKRRTLNLSQSMGYEFGLLDGRVAMRLSTSLTDNGAAWGPAGPDLRDGNFHHVAVSIERLSPTGGKIYIDGALVLTFDPTTQNGSLLNPDPLRIGYHSLSSLFTGFKGIIDELSIYFGALSQSDVHAIYAAGTAGKCPLGYAPDIVQGPRNQAVALGGSASFNVAVTGTALVYQWLFNGSPLQGENGPNLFIAGVTSNHVGAYSVSVTNLYGSALSAAASLTLTNGLQGCVTADPSLFALWKGEGNGIDEFGMHNAVVTGGVSFSQALAGKGFVFNGSDGQAIVSNSPALNFGPNESFSIEGWVRPQASSTAFDFMTIVDKRHTPSIFESLGYEFGLVSGRLIFRLSSVAVDNGAAWGPVGPDLRDGNYHHVAVTVLRNSTNGGRLYVDGQTALVFDPTSQSGDLSNSEPLRIGHHSLSSLFTHFKGEIDELSLYSRALEPQIISAVYASASAGKCVASVAPLITQQPASQNVPEGANVIFAVTAVGTQPMFYQWLRNSTALDGETNRTLTFQGVTLEQAGTYAVLVSNSYGTNYSSNATLVVQQGTCINPAAGLVSFWRGQDSAADQVGENHGSLVGNVHYGTGKVGRAFVFDGNGDLIRVGNPKALQLQDLTIEAWIKRASLSSVSLAGNGNGMIFGYGLGGYGLYIDPTGKPVLTRKGINDVRASTQITDTNFHHVAVTKTGSQVVFFVDGVAYPAGLYNPGFTFTTEAAVGGTADDLLNNFYGTIDEVGIYAGALTTNQIQSIFAAGANGKCLVPVAPTIVQQPTNRTATAGSTVTFSVTAAGSMPMAYQWFHNGNPISSGTNATLTLNGVGTASAGSYFVTVSNVAGAAESRSASLTIILPSPVVRITSVAAQAGATIAIPITLVANGTENALGFSVNFDPALLSYQGIYPGSNTLAAIPMINSSLTSSGKLGIALSMPPGQTFAVGSNNQIAEVIFTTAVRTTPVIAQLTFGDTPILRQIVDVAGLPFSPTKITYASGTVSIAAANFEADVAPRPNGDKLASISDWVFVGRYAARLDYPTNASEFQRADCAPRTTAGDGSIKVSDWVQAGRYAAGLDPLTLAGGPTADVIQPAAAPSGARMGPSLRQIAVADATFIAGETRSVAVELAAQGDESGVGFSVAFDPEAFVYAGSALGAGAAGATLQVNETQAISGKLGFVLMKSVGTSFSVGTAELVRINLRARHSSRGEYPVALGDNVVPCDVADLNANSLMASYVSGTAIVAEPPSLKLSVSGENVVLSWPESAANFTPQVADGLSEPGTWSNVPGEPMLLDGEFKLSVPMQATPQFYRLLKP